MKALSRKKAQDLARRQTYGVGMLRKKPPMPSIDGSSILEDLGVADGRLLTATYLSHHRSDEPKARYHH